MRCESCVYNAAGTHIGFSTCLIPAGMHYCFWGGKTGNNRWYEENVPRAEQIYEQYLKEIEEETK